MYSRITSNLPAKKPSTIFFEDSIKLGIAVREGIIMEVYQTVDVTSAFSFNSETTVEVVSELKQRFTEEVIATKIDDSSHRISHDFPYHFNRNGICFWHGKGPVSGVNPIVSGKAGECIKYIRTKNEGKTRAEDTFLVLRADPYIFNFFESDYLDIWIGTLTKEMIQHCYRVSFGKFDRSFLVEAVRLSLKVENVVPILECLPKNVYVNSLIEGYCESLVKGTK